MTAPLAVMPMTEDLAGAKVWMTQHSTAGIEGVVVKDLGHGYRPGRLLRNPSRIPQAAAELRTALANQREHARCDDLDAFAEADERFHRTIAGMGRNALMVHA